MRPFPPLLSYTLLITRKKAELPAYGPVGRPPAQALTKRQECVIRGYGSRVRELPWTIFYFLFVWMILSSRSISRLNAD